LYYFKPFLLGIKILWQ